MSGKLRFRISEEQEEDGSDWAYGELKLRFPYADAEELARDDRPTRPSIFRRLFPNSSSTSSRNHDREESPVRWTRIHSTSFTPASRKNHRRDPKPETPARDSPYPDENPDRNRDIREPAYHEYSTVRRAVEAAELQAEEEVQRQARHEQRHVAKRQLEAESRYLGQSFAIPKARPATSAREVIEPEEVKIHSSFGQATLALAPAQPTQFGWTEDGLVLGREDVDSLEVINHLGVGSLGAVEEVRRIGGQFPTFVRKRISLPLPKKQAAKYTDIVEEEARILRSLVNPHIVNWIGSYEDRRQPTRPSYCLLMTPVGENDLKTHLTIVGELDISTQASIRSRRRIRDWMACLASALRYMHASGIRHQDIKPSNIICKNDQVLFTDFSSSASFDTGQTTSTDGHAGSTPMYGAPEVTWDRGRHGRATDIFALGCVFSDMLTVAEGRTVQDFQDYLRNNGNAVSIDVDPRLRYSENTSAIMTWFADSHFFYTHVSRMLLLDRKSRPTADEVVQSHIKTIHFMICSCLQEDVFRKSGSKPWEGLFRLSSESLVEDSDHTC